MRKTSGAQPARKPSAFASARSSIGRWPLIFGSGAKAAQPPTITDTALLDTVPAHRLGKAGADKVDARVHPTASTVERRGFRVPFIGHMTLRRQLALLFPLLVLSLGLAWLLFWMDSGRAVSLGLQSRLLGDALMHSQRLARSAPQAARGQSQALRQFGESRKVMVDHVALLGTGGVVGGRRMSPIDATLQPKLRSVDDVWQRTDAAALALLAQQLPLSRVSGASMTLVAELPALADRAEQVAQLLGAAGGSGMDALAGSRLFALSERMAREVLQLSGTSGASPERALALRSDAASFAAALDGLYGALEARRSAMPRDVEARTRLAEIRAAWKRLAAPLSSLIEALPALQAARQAEQRIGVDSEPLRGALSELQAYVLEQQTGPSLLRMGIVACLVLAAVAALGMALVYYQDVERRAREAEAQRIQAERMEREAKRTNDQNQSAILRLMNELQEVADGDLTVQATVSEDITGAIADSVNYTIEELRNLVARINATAGLVNDASSRAQSVAASLQSTTEQQSREIRQTGESVLSMANQINEVSEHASQSAQVARQSLGAAEQGRQAVEKAIAGMDGIRDHIQETAKRIKRLGESSQEIGEIVELISDITEQTNVLALNAAIQAASAGEAGRGFTVVAEEVQRLAERSAEATRQISGLIRTIQIDTHDAVAAMERSTQGVVAGTRLSDAAGKALEEIERVSRQLTELIEEISTTTSSQAQSATGVARNIGKILQFTEQTSLGTHQTASSILQLATLARELQNSVSRFKVNT
jgi:twitching motility protein PilJ